MHLVSERLATYTVAGSAPNEAPARLVSLFRNGSNQAVRIPKEFELNAHQVNMRKVGATLVLEPVPDKPHKGNAAALLLALEEIRKLGPCHDVFPNVDEGLLPLDDIIL